MLDLVFLIQLFDVEACISHCALIFKIYVGLIFFGLNLVRHNPVCLFANSVLQIVRVLKVLFTESEDLALLAWIKSASQCQMILFIWF